MAYDNNFSKMTNGVLFFNGNSLYGKCETVTLPVITAKMIDHKVLGMLGSVKLTSGYDAMDLSFKLNGPMPEIAKASANVFTSSEFMFRGNNQIFQGQALQNEIPYVAICRGTFMESPGGNMQQHENVELNYKVSVNYYKLTHDGKVIHEIDFINNILIVDGVDLLKKYRQNVGLS